MSLALRLALFRAVVPATVGRRRRHGRVTGAYLLASYLNYVQKDRNHILIPVNTEVQAYPWERGFILKAPKLNKEIHFEYDQLRMGMPVTDYINLVTSVNGTSIESFSDVDKKGIKEGDIYPGMTRNGVRVAWGEPARHATAFLDLTTWTYGRNRFRKTTVTFNKNGKVSNIK